MQRFMHFALRQPWLLRVLRSSARVVWMPGLYLIPRYADVCDVLDRDAEFGVPYRPPLDHLGVPFILGSDDSPAYRAQKQALQKAVRHDDPPWVQALSLDAARRALSGRSGELDVLDDVADRVIAETVGAYLGVGSLSTHQLAAARAVFRDVFLNHGDPRVTQRAEVATQQLTEWLDERIRARARDIDRSDDVLARLLQMRAGPEPWLRDPDLRNELCGLVVAWVTNVSRSIVLSVDSLLDRTPVLAAAQNAARTGDVDGVGEFVFEALRFQPPAPAVARTCVREARIGRHTIPRGKHVLALLSSAMLDGSAVPDPNRFQVDRAPSSHLQFGYGIHRCLGEALSRAQVAAVVTELLAGGRVERASRVKWDGPLPSHLFVRIDN
jgi:cytochrome P450